MLNKSEEKAAVEPIDKTGKTGLTGEKKEVLKK